MLRFLPVASSAIYGIALATLAIAGLWTAFVWWPASAAR